MFIDGITFPISDNLLLILGIFTGTKNTANLFFETEINSDLQVEEIIDSRTGERGGRVDLGQRFLTQFYRYPLQTQLE